MPRLAYFAFTLLVCSQTLGSTAEIRGIVVEEKANGAVIRIKGTEMINRSDISVWTSDSGWLYVTIMGGTIDTTQLWPFGGAGIVSGFQADRLPESVQLSFRLSRVVESYEINTEDGENGVMISLRLPLDDTALSVRRLKSLQGNEVTIYKSELTPNEQRQRVLLSYALLLAGGGLVTRGLLQSRGVDFMAGAALVVTGTIMAKRIHMKTKT